MQARASWSPPGGVLGRLCHAAAQRAERLTGDEEGLRQRALATPPGPSLIATLRSGAGVHVVAEVKRRSPSRGILNDGMSAAERAREYLTGGASAISVLTEPGEFGGKDEDLVAVRQTVPIPVLKKDFHVSPAQLWEARSLGSSAALLIVRALGPEGTLRMAMAAAEAGIEALFEVRDDAELQWALDAGAELIGVNRRNLETLDLDDEVPARLLPLVPATCVALAESGIRARGDVAVVAAYGADAVLVGSSLSVAGDGGQRVAALVGVTRQSRRG